MDHDSIKQWFLSQRRSLPWRENPTPYRVWISEVMLQQTQVSVVIPYFQRWMECFPTIEILAKASLERVLKAWEGLGYYSRVRHLHEGARFVVDKYGGKLPSAPDQLAKIKGLGPYTQGAIRSFAFHQKAAAVDGNVLRVLSRYYAIEESIDRAKTRSEITKRVEEFLPDDQPWLVSEGLIELGAIICKKKPHCPMCPLQKTCVAFQEHRVGQFPRKKSRPQTTLLKREVAVVVFNEHFLVQKGKSGKVMADLYEFPYLEKEGDIKELFEKKLGFELEYVTCLPKQKHSFTRYLVHLFPHLFQAKNCDTRYEWIDKDRLHELPFSSGHRKILNNL